MLTEFLQQNPGDAFARYGLAMEYSNAGQTEQALAEFKKLLELHPDYTNGYFMAAQTLERSGRTAGSKEDAGERRGSRPAYGQQARVSEMAGMLEELSKYVLNLERRREIPIVTSNLRIKNFSRTPASKMCA